MKPNRDTLDAAVAHILNAPKDRATITQLCIRPDYGKRKFVRRVHALRETGIAGCRFARAPWLQLPDGSGDPRIQVSILPQRVLDLVYNPNNPEDAQTVHPGDTMVVDMDLSERNLPIGTLLQAGSCVLRVSDKFNDACVKWRHRYGQDALDWVRATPEYRLRGVLCEIFVDGIIEDGAMLFKL